MLFIVAIYACNVNCKSAGDAATLFIVHAQAYFADTVTCDIEV